MNFEEFVDFIGSQDGAAPKPIPPVRRLHPRSSAAMFRARWSAEDDRHGALRLRLQLPWYCVCGASPRDHGQRQDSAHRQHCCRGDAGCVAGDASWQRDAAIPERSNGRNSESRPPFEDETVSYWGQYVAAVVAETLEQAQAAAAAVRVDYVPAKFNVNASLSDTLPAEGRPGGPRVMSQRGDTDAAFASAPVKVDEVYITPVETHNPMEMHATVAVWDGKRYTLYETRKG